MLGVIYGALGAHEQAIDHLQQVVDTVPSFAGAWYELGNAFLRGKQPDAAITAYSEAVKYKPTWPPAYLCLGLAYTQQGSHQKVQEVYEQLLAIDAGAAQTYAEKILQTPPAP